MASPRFFRLTAPHHHPSALAVSLLALALVAGCGSAKDITFDEGSAGSNPGGNGGNQNGGSTASGGTDSVGGSSSVGGSNSVGGSGAGGSGTSGGSAGSPAGGAGADGGTGAGGSGANGGTAGAGADGGSSSVGGSSTGGAGAQGGSSSVGGSAGAGTGGSAGNGGSGGGPVTVDCLSATCTLDGNPTTACCFQKATDGQSAKSACVSGPPENDGCITSDTGQQTRIECQTNADCPGQVCCGYRREVNQTAFYTDLACADSCQNYGPEIPICDPAHGNSECPMLNTQNGPVQLNCVQSQLLPSGYFVCGQ
ncbi:MAG: hypothetical protein H6718_04410 [Polyangiaceae bacterium]|nr:hypothetical protein [Polyangiaceae bacterium]